MKKIYIPKIQTKFVAPFLYNDYESHRDFHFIRRRGDEYFGTAKGNNEYILGIYTAFGKIGAALVNKKGEVFADERLELFKHKNTTGTISRNYLNEFLDQNLEYIVKNSIKASGIPYKKIRGIAVSIGPGDAFSTDHGLKFAQSFGIKHSIPVYAVNRHEAHVLANRMTSIRPSGIPSLDYPYFSVSSQLLIPF